MRIRLYITDNSTVQAFWFWRHAMCNPVFRLGQVWAQITNAPAGRPAPLGSPTVLRTLEVIENDFSPV